MSDLTFHPLFSSPLYAGEYLIASTPAGLRVLESKFKSNRYGWHPASLHDSMADTALFAYQLADEYLCRDSFEQTTLVDIQIRHFACNLAAKLHRLAPFESRSMVSHHAINTVLRMSQLADNACMQMLLDAGLVLPSNHLGHTQMLLRTAYLMLGHIPAGLIDVQRGSTGNSDYAQQIVAVLTQYPPLIRHVDHLDHRVLHKLKQMLDAETKPLPNHDDLRAWLSQSSVTCSQKTNFDALRLESLSPAELLENFTVVLTTVAFGTENGSGKLGTTNRIAVLDKAAMASHLLSANITSGCMEVIGGAAKPVFRTIHAIACDETQRQLLSAITLERINGGVPNQEGIRMFCDLFYLEFDFAVSPTMIDVLI